MLVGGLSYGKYVCIKFGEIYAVWEIPEYLRKVKTYNKITKN